VGLFIGIVVPPNVGESTLFNPLFLAKRQQKPDVQLADIAEAAAQQRLREAGRSG